LLDGIISSVVLTNRFVYSVVEVGSDKPFNSGQYAV
jgi:hypothetical protein